MNREILVSLLKPVVLLDMMQVISPDHNGAVHFHTFDNASQNTSTDVNSSSERTLLVNVSSLICLFQEMKWNLLRTVPTIVIAHTFCASPNTRISYRQCLPIQVYFWAV